ncbi:MAG: YIP1 family protein, partial [Thermoanaerobaculia bacterium]
PPPPPPQPPYMPPPAVSGGLPWETQAIGPQPLLDTAMLFIKAPEQAWRVTRETGDYMRPLLFGVIVGWVGLVFNAVWSSMFGAGWARFIPEQYRDAVLARAGGGILSQVVLGPLFIAIALFIGAAIFHVCFMIVGALASSKSQFEGTFRLVSYSSIAHIAYVVPVVGGLAALVWRVYLMVVGAQQLHKTTQNKALLGIVLPIALCCVCAILGMAIAGAALFSAFRR